MDNRIIGLGARFCFCVIFGYRRLDVMCRLVKLYLLFIKYSSFLVFLIAIFVLPLRYQSNGSSHTYLISGFHSYLEWLEHAANTHLFIVSVRDKNITRSLVSRIYDTFTSIQLVSSYNKVVSSCLFSFNVFSYQIFAKSCRFRGTHRRCHR